VRGADLRATGLTSAEIRDVITDEKTLLPTDVSISADSDTSDDLSSAWSAFNHQAFSSALLATTKCIAKFQPQADSLELALEEREAAMPPVGAVPDAQRRAIFAKGELNDVATCYWIRAQVAARLGEMPAEKEALIKAANYKYARTWDPRGWFWSPAADASARLSATASRPR
jgi:hypothetical protein